jgi:hypothetical protein
MEINKQLYLQIKNKTFALAEHPVFSHNPIRLMDIGFNKSYELAKKRIGDTSPQRLHKLYNSIFSKIYLKESKHKDILEKIAEEVIRDMYLVPNQINIKPSIVNQDSLEYDFNNQVENSKIKISSDRLKIIQDEVDKRIILNSIVNGSSAMIWTSAYYIAKEKLDEIDENLVKYYNEYSAIVNCLLWMQEPEINMELINPQGISKVKFENGLFSEGVNFPVLLLETNKVVLDFLISKGIPEDFSENELKLYYSLADDYRHEIYHNTLSSVIYSDFLETINTDSKNIPKIISKLSELNSKELKSIFISIQDNKDEALNKLKFYKIC